MHLQTYAEVCILALISLDHFFHRERQQFSYEIISPKQINTQADDYNQAHYCSNCAAAAASAQQRQRGSVLFDANRSGDYEAGKLVTACRPYADSNMENPNDCIYGRIEMVKWLPVRAFKGIPFATAERLGKPKLKTWDDIRGAVYDTLGRSCWQTIDEWVLGNFDGADMWNPKTPMSDDCLNLNIWVPARRFHDTTVIVWIFGGGYWYGSNSLEMYGGGVAATFADKIVVAINYRIGAPGFLYLPDDNESNCEYACGNMGLHDQYTALQWIQQNIHVFGGDPNRIILWGESAGSASVGYHLIANRPRDFIKGAIMQSGSPTSPWAFSPPEEAQRRGLEFVSNTGCLMPTKDATIRCLQQPNMIRRWHQLSHEWMNAAGTDYFNESTLYFPFVPTVDKDFLLDHPINLLRAERVHKCDLLIGSVKNEGAFFVIYTLLDPLIMNYRTDEGGHGDGGLNVIDLNLGQPESHKVGLTREHLFEYLNNSFPPWRYLDEEKLALLRELYFQPLKGDANVTGETIFGIMDALVGDWGFTCPTIEFADYFYLAHSRHAARHQNSTPSSRNVNEIESPAHVNYYYFTHTSDSSQWPSFMGVLHGEEIEFFFGQCFDTMNKQCSRSDQDMSAAMLSELGHFAYWGQARWRPWSDGFYGYHEFQVPVQPAHAVVEKLPPRADVCKRLWRDLKFPPGNH